MDKELKKFLLLIFCKVFEKEIEEQGEPEIDKMLENLLKTYN